MPQPKISLPVLLQYIHADLATLGHIWVKYFGEEVACKAFAFLSRQECEDGALKTCRKCSCTKLDTTLAYNGIGYRG